uniref:Transposase, mutator type n=1 Tax=Tanacetum cinerariifolium TaxID=118510 RepID=A0A699HZ39_TANCI|nr:transposase, mutator type [Tanacetum cinerariifolium]
MVNLSVDLNEPKDSSKTNKAAQNGRTPKSLTLEIHHGGWFTPIPSRSYISGHVSSVNVVDIDEFCLHDLKDMVVKVGYGVEDLMYCHFLIPSLGLDYGLRSLNVDADVLEMAKYVKDYKIILVYVKHGSSNVDTSIFVTPKKGVAIAIDNHLRKAPIEIDSSPDVNRNLTPMCHRILKKRVGTECVEDPFEELDNILGEYAHIRKKITGIEITRNKSTMNEIIGKQMVVRVGNSSTVDDVLELEMLFETEGVGRVRKFKEVEVDADNESNKESDTEGDYTMDSDSEDLDFDSEHDDVFDDDEHIIEKVHVNMNNFIFTADPKHDTTIGGVDVQDDDLDVIDYDSFGSDLDDGIDSERRMKLMELRRIGKQKNKGPNKYNFYLGQQFASKEIMKGRVKKHSVKTRRQLILVKMTMKGVYMCLGALKQGFRACGREILGLDECFMSGHWPGQILTAVEVYANNRIYPVAYDIVEAESKASRCWFLNLLREDLGLIQAIASVFPSAEHRYYVRYIHENMKLRFKGGMYKEMLWNAAKANSESGFKKKMEYLMKRIVVVQKVIDKTAEPPTPYVTKMFDAIKKKATEKWELTEIPCKHVVAAIYMSKNSVGVGQPMNGRDMWPVVESKTVIIPPLYKPLIDRPPKKRKKSNDEITSQSASSGKLSRKGKLVSCGKYGSVGHNRKGCRGQCGGSSQAGARKVFGEAAGATDVSCQAASARKVYGQAAGATNISGQAAGARKVSGQAVGSRKVFG